jgi:hypothetical protein
MAKVTIDVKRRDAPHKNTTVRKVDADHVVATVVKRQKDIETPVQQKKVAVTQKTNGTVMIRPIRAAEILTSFLDKVEVGELRGRKVRPELIITKGELQALECAVAILTEQFPQRKRSA